MYYKGLWKFVFSPLPSPSGYTNRQDNVLSSERPVNYVQRFVVLYLLWFQQIRIQKVTPLILFLRWLDFSAISILKELTVTSLLQYIAVICLNHAVMPSAVTVFSQLFSYTIFLFFSSFLCYVHFRLCIIK